MKKEIYRSFDDVLSVNNQDGYIVYELEEWFQIETVSVRQDVIKTKIRIYKNDAPSDWSDFEAIGELISDVDNMRIPGQFFFADKWRTPRTISEKYKDYNWKRYC